MRHPIFALTVLLALTAPMAQAQTGHSPESAQIGAERHPMILRRFGGEVANEALRAYVEAVGQRIAAVSAASDAEWHFTVLDSPQVNAFALPGGYVYVTRGLLALAGDEAELAAVLAHEIVHVTEAHVEARMAIEAEDNTGEVVGTLLGNLLGGVVSGSDTPLGDAVRETVEDTLGARMEFSREQEFAADELSIPLLVAAGYDPLAAPDFLRAMRDQHALIARLEGRGYNPSQVPFFADHPAPDDRIERAELLASNYQFVVAPERGAEAYLAAIHGMVFGDSAQQGFVRGRAFLHPELGFSFAVPEGYIITNTARAIRVRGPNGAYMIMDGGRDDGVDLRDYIARQWVDALRSPGQPRIRTPRVRMGEINGLEAARAEVERRNRGRREVLTLTAIRLNGTIYRFMAASPRGQDGAQAAMLDAVRSFAALSEDAAEALHPYRLVRYVIAPGDTVESLTSDAPDYTAAADWFMLLNRLSPGEMPPPGTEVKRIIY